MIMTVFRTMVSFHPKPAAGNEDSLDMRRGCRDISSYSQKSLLSAQQSCVSFRKALTPDR